MEGFKQQKKIACYKEGGQVGYKSRKNHEETKEMSEDIKQDKAIVKKGVAQHEAAKHKGEGKTELKLKTGGRAKKEKGTVKKYCGGSKVKKYEEGGIVETLKGVGTRLKENVMGTPEQNAAAQARLDKYEASKKAVPMPQPKGPLSETDKKMMATPSESNKPEFLRGLTAKKRGGKC